jgi:hypothetical protein
MFVLHWALRLQFPSGKSERATQLHNAARNMEWPRFGAIHASRRKKTGHKEIV